MKYIYDETKPFWFNYSKAIIETQDVDPVYIAMRRSVKQLGEEKLNRFIVAMSLFYHTGMASAVTDASTPGNFWDTALGAYEGTPRGKERRYFRGQQGLDCLNYLKANFKTPTDFLEAMYSPSYRQMVKNFKPVPAFGDYFIWKYLDFFERVLGRPVDVEGCYEFLPAPPVKGAYYVARESGIQTAVDKKDQPRMLREVVDLMVQEFRVAGVKAPANPNRLANMQEAETCLCGIRHLYNTPDWVGSDIEDKYESFGGFSGETVSILRSNLPERLPRDFFITPQSVVDRLGVKMASSGSADNSLSRFFS